LLAVQAVKNLS